MSDKIAMLERAPLFAGVDRDVLAQIAELTEVEEVAAGTTLGRSAPKVETPLE